MQALFPPPVAEKGNRACCAAVEKIEEKRKPDDFWGTANGNLRWMRWKLMKQITLRWLHLISLAFRSTASPRGEALLKAARLRVAGKGCMAGR